LDLYGWLKKKLGLWSRSFEYIQNISEGCHSCLIDLYGIMLTQPKLLYHIYKKNAQHTKMNSLGLLQDNLLYQNEYTQSLGLGQRSSRKTLMGFYKIYGLRWTTKE
jgi:hypothetical protein